MTENPYKGKTGFTRLWNALCYSFSGLGAAFRHEPAFRQEVVLALILIPTAWLLPVSLLGKALMIASVVLVLIVELLNSALEAAVDRVSLEIHPLAKRAKDMASAAILLSLINWGAVWLLVLLNND
ncbi:MAG TPA: diacylglycerol kinase [Acidiferrobacterales bacterium]|nr:diacylglycerol kinase [Acidiferrobacterales bacterium]